jgi:hypothetical protein
VGPRIPTRRPQVDTQAHERGAVVTYVRFSSVQMYRGLERATGFEPATKGLRTTPRPTNRLARITRRSIGRGAGTRDLRNTFLQELELRHRALGDVDERLAKTVRELSLSHHPRDVVNEAAQIPRGLIRISALQALARPAQVSLQRSGILLREGIALIQRADLPAQIADALRSAGRADHPAHRPDRRRCRHWVPCVQECVIADRVAECEGNVVRVAAVQRMRQFVRGL